MKIGSFAGNLLSHACTGHREKQEEEELMKSRAELLAEIEENRLENNELGESLNELSLAEPEARDGYNPYDHPGQPKEVPDDADITARRREIYLRHR